MKLQAAVDYFGTKAKLARQLRVHTSNIEAWGEDLPEIYARRLHEITKGKLKYIPAEYPWQEKKLKIRGKLVGLNN